MTCCPIPDDQETFYDYLIANVKLYFDKFESALDVGPEEPTNQAYDTAKEEPAPEEEPAAEDELDLGGEEGAPEEAPPEEEEEFELEL